MKRAVFGLAAMLFASPLRAQTGGTEIPADLPSALPEGLPEGPIVSVRMDPPLHAENPLTRTGLTVGENFTRERARAALRASLDSGTFAEARISARLVEGGVEVIVRGERRYHLRAVTLVGVRARPIDEVRSTVTLRADTRVTDTEVSEGAHRLEQSYRDIGWNEARVESEWHETEDPAERVLILHVIEGEPTRIDFVGLDDVPSAQRDAVRAELGMRAGDVADPRRLRETTERVLPVLRRAGYLSVTGLSIELVPSTPRRVTLRVRMQHGDVYRVRWEGVTRVPTQELVDALHLDEERDIEAPTLSVLAGRVRSFYVRRAFPDARVHVEVQAATTASPGRRDVVFQVTEGAQVFVGALHFPGAHQFTEDSLADDVRGLLVSELPGGTAFAAPGVAVDEVLNGEDRSNVPHSRPPPRLQLFPERTFVPEVYTEASRRIVLRYREQGYLDTEIAAQQVQRVRDPDGVSRFRVTFQITEGPRTFLDEATFEGNHDLASAALADAAAMTLGLPIDYRAIEEARVRITDLYRERAFAFARVEPEVLRSPDRSRARVRFTVHEGPRVRVGSIRIEGATRTSEPLIRERLALHEGGYYLLSSVRTSQRRLDQLGVFTGVNISFDDPDIEAPVKTVVIQLSERPRYSLEFRLGYSLGQGLRGAIEGGVLNLFGSAISFTARAEMGYFVEIPGLTPVFPGNVRPENEELLQYRFTGSFGFPYIPLLGPDFSSSLDGAVESRLTTDSLFYTYRIQSRGVSASLTNRTVSHLTLTLTGEVQFANAKLYGATTIQSFLQGLSTQCDAMTGSDADRCRLRLITLQQQLRFPDGDNVLGAVRLGTSYDRRDSQFNPTRGVYLSLTNEILSYFSRPDNAPEPTPVTWHIEGRATGYLQVPESFPLPVWLRWLRRTVFASSLRGGVNVQIVPGGQTHPLRQFLLGGADSMRGWLQNSMVPEDIAQAVRVNPSSPESTALLSTLGGDVYVNWRNELRIPTGLCVADSLCLGLGIFLDTGNLWRNPANVDLSHMRFSPGFGARFNTPFGVISFDLGFNTAPRDYVRESPYAFQFSLGVF